MKRFECKICGHFTCRVFCTENLSNKCFECKETIFKTKWYEIEEEEEKKEIKAEEILNLPSWCKVGKVVYYTNGKLYCQIHEVDKKRGIILFNSEYLITDFVSISELAEARLRPFNETEMRGLVGKVITEKDDNFTILITSFVKDAVFIDGRKIERQRLLNDFTMQDGTPCGVYEHFENGEWVK